MAEALGDGLSPRRFGFELPPFEISEGQDGTGLGFCPSASVLPCQ